jgi:hypothetical protein
LYLNLSVTALSLSLIVNLQDCCAVQAAWLPFAVVLLNYFFALPGYVYLNALTGTGATRTVFIFQVTTTIAYLSSLWGLSRWSVPLAAYWSVEYLYAILLGIQAVIYLKYKR